MTSPERQIEIVKALLLVRDQLLTSSFAPELIDAALSALTLEVLDPGHETRVMMKTGWKAMVLQPRVGDLDRWLRLPLRRNGERENIGLRSVVAKEDTRLVVVSVAADLNEQLLSWGAATR